MSCSARASWHSSAWYNSVLGTIGTSAFAWGRLHMMIDIFNHFMPKAYLDRLGAVIPGHVALTAFPRLKTLWDVDARLSLLDEFDGLQQVLSLANPPLELIAPPDQTPELARLANNSLADSAAGIPIDSRLSSHRCP